MIIRDSIELDKIIITPEEIHLKVGKPRDFWLVNAAFIKEFIIKEKLKDVTETTVLPVKAAGENVLSANIVKEYGDIRGGMRAPHLHYNGKVFMLDKKQWNKFSETILAQLREKLNSVNSVSFEQVMEISDTIDSL